MSQITLYTATPVRSYKQHIGVSGSATILQGQVVRFDGDTAKFLPTLSGSGIAGFSITDTGLNGRMTVIEEGILDVGSAIDGLAFGALVYACASAGKLETASAVAVGRVIPGWGNVGTPDKLLEVTPSWRP